MGNNQTAAALSAIATSVNWERSGLDLQAIVEAGNQGKLGKPLTDWLIAQSWKEKVAEVAESIRTMIVDHAKGFKNLIAECGNGLVDGDITEKRFPITDEDGGEWEYDLWDPQGSVSSSDAVQRMKGDDKDNPWMPARFGHLLVFGTQNPDAQRKNPIVALGSVSKVDGDRNVPDLFGDDRERRLRLSWWDGDWGSHCRFLRVRKIVKKS